MEKIYVQPSQIALVGNCIESYVPLPQNTLPSSISLNQMKNEIIREINIVRTNPKAYADQLARLKFENFGPKSFPSTAISVGADRLWYCGTNDEFCRKNYMKNLQVVIDYLRNLPGPLSEVKEHPKLSEGAAILAKDRGKINGPQHLDSQGRDPWCRAEIAEYPNTTLGECLGGGHISAAGTVIGFLMSPGHRDILLRADANEIGVDQERHGEGLRDVIIMGNKNFKDRPGSCN